MNSSPPSTISSTIPIPTNKEQSQAAIPGGMRGGQVEAILDRVKNAACYTTGVVRPVHERITALESTKWNNEPGQGRRAAPSTSASTPPKPATGAPCINPLPRRSRTRMVGARFCVALGILPYVAVLIVMTFFSPPAGKSKPLPPGCRRRPPPAPTPTPSPPSKPPAPTASSTPPSPTPPSCENSSPSSPPSAHSPSPPLSSASPPRQFSPPKAKSPASPPPLRRHLLPPHAYPYLFLAHALLTSASVPGP